MNEHRHLFGHLLDAEPRERPIGIVAPGPIGPLGLFAAIGAILVEGAQHVSGIALTWLERYRQRRTLENLSDHMLKDMGVSRADVDREVNKQFWRE